MKKIRLQNLWPALLILMLDQIAKALVRSSLTLNASIRVWGDSFFRLTHVENSGVAFGLQPGSLAFLILFNAIASLILIYVLLISSPKTPDRYPPMLRFSLALILGGALGNLIDRIAFGRVTDFLDFDFPDLLMDRWPVFNIADSSVTVGVTLWCLWLLFRAKAQRKAIASGSAQP